MDDAMGGAQSCENHQCKAAVAGGMEAEMELS
jgi:hypothetical protein